MRRLSEQLDNVQHRFFPSIPIPIDSCTAYSRGERSLQANAAIGSYCILESAYDVIANADFPNLIAFMTAIHISAVTSAISSPERLPRGHLQRFNLFLVRQFNAGFKDKGSSIMDRSGREVRVRELMAEFDRHGTQHGYLGNIIDVPYFADSLHTRMVQMADLLAFAGHRYFNANDSSYLQKVLPRVDKRSPRGPMVGLKHIVARNHPCRCIACT